MREFLEMEHILDDGTSEDRVLGMRVIETTDDMEADQRFVLPE